MHTLPAPIFTRTQYGPQNRGWSLFLPYYLKCSTRMATTKQRPYCQLQIVVLSDVHQHVASCGWLPWASYP
jgi:hypothetical protein